MGIIINNCYPLQRTTNRKQLRNVAYFKKIQGGSNMSGQALGFMLVMWGGILAASFLGLRATLKNK
jgi:hypothetical protein